MKRVKELKNDIKSTVTDVHVQVLWKSKLEKIHAPSKGLKHSSMSKRELRHEEAHATLTTKVFRKTGETNP